jgi:vacuolar-type H+-ATPase subunit E/Vma4
LGREASDAAASLKSDLQQTAKAATRAAQEQASAFAADVGHEINKAAEEQKARGTEAMQGFARAINSAAGELEEQSPTVARYVRDAAKQVDSLSNNIRGRSVTELMQAATDLARSQPAVFFAGAMAAGFALSRFLKSSAASNEGGSARGSHAGSATSGAGSLPTSRNLSPDTPTASSYVPGGRQPSMPRNS